ncbi:MAG: CerR family C-terminal domain-containing protein [Sphingomonadaceae bacterium]|nr:CerR family C-terminal domain-containing protein [Sphingomonadaceae bacterium]
MHSFVRTNNSYPTRQPTKDRAISLHPASAAASPPVDPVRQRILEAAVEQFAEYGFEGTSTRAIAAAAGAAMSSITYQFGGKEGLYLAAADHIGEQISHIQLPGIISARQAVDRGDLSPTDAIVAILGEMANMMLDERSESWSAFIIREQQKPGEAFDRLFACFIQPMSESMIELVGMVRTDLSGRKLRAVATGLIGQVIALRSARAAMMRILDISTMGDDVRTMISEAITANARAILQAKG